MKQFKSLMYIAAAAMAFTGCSKDDTEIPVPEVPQTVITVMAEGGDTRTTIDGAGNISWDATGESLYVFEKADNNAPVFRYTDTDYTLSNGTATFKVSFDTKTATSFLYGAVSPKAAYITDSNTDLTAIKLSLPQVQSPKTDSYDPAADLLIAKPKTTTTQPTTGVSFSFGRLIGIGKMTVKNLDLKQDEFVRKVVFTAPGKVVTGRGKANLGEGKPLTTEWGYSSTYKFDNVELSYQDNVIAAKTFDAWFTCAPFALSATDKFSVKITSNKGIYEREVTLAAGKTLVFTASELSTFGVDMTGATFTEIEEDKSIFTLPFGDGSTTADVTYDTSYNMAATGVSSTGLSYAFSATSKQIRNNGNAFVASDYTGATGKSFWWAANGTLTISNITLGSNTNFQLTFGGKASQGASTALVEISKDGTNFFPLVASPITLGLNSVKDMLKTINFHLGSALSEKVAIRVTGGTNAVIDDIKLSPLETPAAGSLLIDFLTLPSLTTLPDNGETLSFSANNGTAGNAPATQEIMYEWDGHNCTFEAAKDAADTWYTISYNASVKDGAITVAPTEYTSTTANRTGTVTLTVKKAGVVAKTAVITINQIKAGGVEPVELTLDFGTNGNSVFTTPLPTSSGTKDPQSYTFMQNSNSYNFTIAAGTSYYLINQNSAGVSRALFLGKSANTTYMQLPAIAGMKLTSVVLTGSSGGAAAASAYIVSADGNNTVTTGGESQLIVKSPLSNTYTLTATEAGTAYRIAASSANNIQLTKIELKYE